MFKKKKDKRDSHPEDQLRDQTTTTVVETHADVNITTEVPDQVEEDTGVSNEELIEGELGARDDEEVADLPLSSEDIKGAFKGMAKSLKKDAKESIKADTGLHPEARLIISKVLDFWVPTFLTITLVYILGYFGFHFLYAVLVLAGLYAFDSARQERMWSRRFRELQRLHKQQQTEISSDPTKETVVWMNTILEKFWPKVAPWGERLILIKAKEAIENALKTNKPAIVDTVEMPDLRLGTTPIQIEYMKTHQTDEGTYKLDIQFAYAGEIKVVIKPIIKIPFRTALPIVIEDLEISAGIHLELDLIKGYLPFIRTLHLHFSEPKVDLSLKPLKSGIMDLPIIHGWITGTIANVLLNLEIHHHFIEGIDDAQLEAKKKSRSNPLSSGASALGGGVKAVGKGIGTGVATIGKGTVTGVTTVGKGIGTGVTTVGKGVGTGVAFVGKGTVSGVTNVGKGIGKGFKKLNPLKKSVDGEPDEIEEEVVSPEMDDKETA